MWEKGKYQSDFYSGSLSAFLINSPSLSQPLRSRCTKSFHKIIVECLPTLSRVEKLSENSLFLEPLSSKFFTHILGKFQWVTPRTRNWPHKPTQKPKRSFGRRSQLYAISRRKNDKILKREIPSLPCVYSNNLPMDAEIPISNALFKLHNGPLLSECDPNSTDESKVSDTHLPRLNPTNTQYPIHKSWIHLLRKPHPTLASLMDSATAPTFLLFKSREVNHQ